jgi:ceramide glucosyltransferase
MTIVAPLADQDVGAVSTFCKARDAGRWYERMELLTLNADHFAIVMLGSALGVADFCFGASLALTKTMLAQIGGLSSLGDYLVEDNEIGQRVVRAGKKLAVLPYVVDMTVDLQSPSHWWQKQTYWDQNTRAAVPLIFAFSLVLRVVPLALALAMLRTWDATSLTILAVALSVRLTAAAAVLGLALRDAEGLRSLWLIPVKDVLSLFWFVRSFVKRTVIWRGVEMSLTRDGRLVSERSERPS